MSFGIDLAVQFLLNDDCAVSTQTDDPAGNVAGITNFGPFLALVSRFTYTYDRADRRTNQVEADGTRSAWKYDRASRLLTEQRFGGPAGTTFVDAHSYDPAGNRTVHLNGATRTTYTYTPAIGNALSLSFGQRFSACWASLKTIAHPACRERGAFVR
jgi:YD repeat-containing protein